MRVVDPDPEPDPTFEKMPDTTVKKEPDPDPTFEIQHLDPDHPDPT